MPEEIVMVSTCPLCGGPEEVLSMVTVEIDRIIPKGRATIVICRICAGAVIRAVEALEVSLLSGKPFQLIARAEAPAESEPASEARAYPCRTTSYSVGGAAAGLVVLRNQSDGAGAGEYRREPPHPADRAGL